jgi:putative endonuclease
MYYVYILKSLSHPKQIYTGLTNDMGNRLKVHNEGKSIHTAKYIPWELETYFAFKTKHQAARFEHYLKTGSGQAFAKKHFLESAGLCPEALAPSMG